MSEKASPIMPQVTGYLLQQCFEIIGNHRLSASGSCRARHLTEGQRTAMDDEALMVVQQERRVVELPVGTEHFKRGLLQKVNTRESAELVSGLVPMKDIHASFPSLCLSAVSRLLNLVCTVPPSIKNQAAADYDAFVE